MKPTPKVVSTICTVCDEPWEDHGDRPTVADCIRLLKRHRAALVIRPTPTIWPHYPGGWWSTPINVCQTNTAAIESSYEITNGLSVGD